MTLKEAAERLNIAESTARRWVKSGRLAGVMSMGAYGPEYTITDDALDRARASTKTPVIIRSEEQTVTVEQMQGLVEKAMQKSMGAIVRATVEDASQPLADEIASLRAEMAEIKKGINALLNPEPKKNRWNIFRRS